MVLQASTFIFDWIFIKLAGNQGRHKILDKFKFWPDRISHFGVTCLCAKKISYILALSNMNSSKTSWPVLVKFYVWHQCGGGKAALGFGEDWIKTLVVMATKSSH